MLRRVVPAVLLVGSVLLPIGPASAATVDVNVDNFAFDPGVVRVRLGDDVRWTFVDATSHDTASDDGFWDSPLLNGGETFTWVFVSAGTFGYHCTPHPHMTGAVAVRPRAKASDGGWTIRWATDTAAGYEYDVQVRRKGTDTWRELVTDTTDATALFEPPRSGTWFVRARTSTSDGAETSRWSPRRTLKA